MTTPYFTSFDLVRTSATVRRALQGEPALLRITPDPHGERAVLRVGHGRDAEYLLLHRGPRALRQATRTLAAAHLRVNPDGASGAHQVTPRRA